MDSLGLQDFYEPCKDAHKCCMHKKNQIWCCLKFDFLVWWKGKTTWFSRGIVAPIGIRLRGVPRLFWIPTLCSHLLDFQSKYNGMYLCRDIGHKIPEKEILEDSRSTSKTHTTPTLLDLASTEVSFLACGFFLDNSRSPFWIWKSSNTQAGCIQKIPKKRK